MSLIIGRLRSSFTMNRLNNLTITLKQAYKLKYLKGKIFIYSEKYNISFRNVASRSHAHILTPGKQILRNSTSALKYHTDGYQTMSCVAKIE